MKQHKQHMPTPTGDQRVLGTITLALGIVTILLSLATFLIAIERSPVSVVRTVGIVLLGLSSVIHGTRVRIVHERVQLAKRLTTANLLVAGAATVILGTLFVYTW